jgi:hypothetical protein
MCNVVFDRCPGSRIDLTLVQNRTERTHECSDSSSVLKVPPTMDAKGGAEGGGATVTCQKCKTALATYESAPCGCSKFCVDCARKLATGGKCKVRGTRGCSETLAIVNARTSLQVGLLAPLFIRPPLASVERTLPTKTASKRSLRVFLIATPS